MYIEFLCGSLSKYRFIHPFDTIKCSWPTNNPFINVNVRKANRHSGLGSRFLREPTHGSHAHTHLMHTCPRTHDQCRLMTMLMGKCTGFPQGHQGPEGFNWEDQILLPFSSSSPSPVHDNAVCILIHLHVTHSVSQSVSEPAGSWGRGGGRGGEGGMQQPNVFFPPTNKTQLISGSLSYCFLLVLFSPWIEHQMNFVPEKK